MQVRVQRTSPQGRAPLFGSPRVRPGAPDLTLHSDRYTLGVMQPKPASAAESGAGEVERYGPLELRRLRKDDGRRLIVYSRVHPSPARHPPPQHAPEHPPPSPSSP